MTPPLNKTPIPNIKYFSMLSVHLIASSFAHAAEKIPAENISAWGSSVWGKSHEEKTIDGSGLSSGLHDEAHDHMWLTDSNDSGGHAHATQETSVGPAWISYKFDKVYELQDIKIWNYSQTNFASRGLRNVSIEYSLDGDSWLKLGNYEIDKAKPSGACSKTINLNIDARHIVITAHQENGNWGGDLYGLSEVQFIASTSRKASSPKPFSDADELSVSQKAVLSWIPGRGSVASDIYLSTDKREMDDDARLSGDGENPYPAFKARQTSQEYKPDNLKVGQTYYWRVDSIDDEGKIERGYVWTFTVNRDTRMASSAKPMDMEEGVDESAASLSWNSGEGAGSHDVYFGQDSKEVATADHSSPTYKGSQERNSFSVGALQKNEVYFWRIDEVVGEERIKGDLWSFRTGSSSLDFGIGAPDQLYVARATGLSTADLITLQSLQGILAQEKAEIFIETPNNRMWLEDLVDHYGITYTRNDNFEWYLEYFADRLDGYILYDALDKPSLRVASSLSGIKNAIAVDISIQAKVESITNLACIEDARGKDEKWLFKTNWEFLRKDLIIGNNGNSMQDIAPAFRGFSNLSSDSEFADRLYRSLETETGQYFGWIDPAAGTEDESLQVTYHSKYGLDTNGAGLNYNYSTYVGLASKSPKVRLRQPVSENSYKDEDNVHYVMFYMSDLGNLAFLPSAKGFANNINYFGHPRRGEFGMGWGTSQLGVKLMPNVMSWWYRNATRNDGFVASTYVFPSDHPALDSYVSLLDSRMRQADLGVLWIYDDLNNESWDFESPEYEPYLKKFAKMETLRGAIYAEYFPYYAYDGRIRWVEGKPFANIKYVMDENNDDGLSLSSKINALPTDVHDEASYTIVLVNAWGFKGKLMPEVCEAVDHFDKHVRVVTPHEFFERLHMNFPSKAAGEPRTK